MVANPHRGVGMRWLGAVVLVAAAVLAGFWAWWPAGVEQVEDDLYDPSALRAFVRESVQAAVDLDRFAAFHFVKEDGLWTPGDDWFDEASVDLNYLVNKDQVERLIADLSVARDLPG